MNEMNKKNYMKSIVLSVLFAVALFGASCSKENDGENQNYDLLVDESWRVTAYSSNGTPDPGIVAQQHTYNFRSDGKLYFSQIGPVYRDTFNFSMQGETTMKLTKPGSGPAVLTLTISLLNDTSFDFILESSENTDVDTYKTVKL